jgi:peptidoglycan/xylan/chitin deacetylase (PgdA/CDA1 family)
MLKIFKKIIFWLFYIRAVWQAVRYFNRDKIVILMYHGVTDREIGVWTQLSAARFEEQMRYISRHYHPIALSEAVAMLRKERPVVPYSIVVTFDDGFRNNRVFAHPILQKYKIPATIFLTTSFVDRSGRYDGFLWTDYIYLLLMSTAEILLDLNDFDLGQFNISDNKKKYLARDAICGALKRIPYQKKAQIIETIRCRLKCAINPQLGEPFLPLGWDEIKELSESGLVSFGAHSVTHEILTQLPDSVMKDEIDQSQETLERKLPGKVAYFAYPNGTTADFSESIKGIVAEKFDCALTTIEGLNRAGCDMYELKRINIGNEMGLTEFKMTLSGTTFMLQRFRLGRKNLISASK